jgi:tetratricopeptide (TPR) repeat protein
MTYSQKLATAWLVMLLPTPMAMAVPTQAELAVLPPYCAARLNESSEEFKSWRSTMGGDFIHIHHYCNGLSLLSRARGTFSSSDNGTLGAAVREFDYVLTNATPGFYLRPEILMNRGMALSMMKHNGEAISNLLQAIELDAKQPRAYMALADLYDEQKNRSKALQTVTEGLRHNPGSRSLQRRYTELGGKLPYPSPIEPVPADPLAAKTDKPATPTPASAAEPASGTPATVAPVAEPAAPAHIGSPKNPYCRFCPD